MGTSCLLLIRKIDHSLFPPAKIACNQCSGKQEKEVLVVASYCQTWTAGLLDTVIEILKCENISCAAESLTDGRSPQAPAGHSGHTRSAAQR